MYVFCGKSLTPSKVKSYHVKLYVDKGIVVLECLWNMLWSVTMVFFYFKLSLRIHQVDKWIWEVGEGREGWEKWCHAWLGR